MDQMASMMGTYLFKDKAAKEFSSVGNDINSLKNSITGGTKSFVNKVKGKIQKPLAEFLKEHDLPIGLFPRDATNYEYNEVTKKLVVQIPDIVEVNYRDGSILRFDKTVSGIVEKAKFSEVEGMKTKVTFLMVKVTNVATEGPSKLLVTAGLNWTRTREAYEVIRDGVFADQF